MVEFPILTIGVLKLSNSLIHKEKKIVPRGTIFFYHYLARVVPRGTIICRTLSAAHLHRPARRPEYEMPDQLLLGGCG